MLTLTSVWRFKVTVAGLRLLITLELVGAGRGNCPRRPADTVLKQLVGILFPGHWVPGLPGPVAGTVQPEGISEGLEAHEVGTKIGVGTFVTGLISPLKSPESSAAVGTVTFPGAKDCLYLS